MFFKNLPPMRTVIIRGELGDAGISVELNQETAISTASFSDLLKVVKIAAVAVLPIPLVQFVHTEMSAYEIANQKLSARRYL